jgi:hypothetical protein
MARRKRLEGAPARWAGDAEAVWTGMADWRAAHPKATFSEIEAALDERLNQVRAGAGRPGAGVGGHGCGG